MSSLLADAQNQEIMLRLNEEDKFLIKYEIWDSEIEITDVWANKISILVLLSEPFLRSIAAKIVAQLHQEEQSDYIAALATKGGHDAN